MHVLFTTTEATEQANIHTCLAEAHHPPPSLKVVGEISVYILLTMADAREQANKFVCESAFPFPTLFIYLCHWNRQQGEMMLDRNKTRTNQKCIL